MLLDIPDLYDNQHNYSSGGHHKWFESKRLFMQSNIEASGSTILCLINNMKLDYQHSLPGENLTRFLIKNYGQKDCYLKLNKMIKEAYVNKFSIEEYDKNRDIMLTNVAMIESTINNIESYLCYLYEQHGSSFIITQVAEDLITSSFAYYLADEEQKKRLKELFQTIAQRIQETLGIDQHTYYSRSMYGIAVSKEILNWVNNNLLEIQGLSLEDLASTLINTFYDLFSDKVTLEKEVLYRILLEWIEGKMYYDMYTEYRDVCSSVYDIERICSNDISYNFSFFIGNIIDAIDDRADQLKENLLLFQKMVKYGLKGHFAIMFSECVFDERSIVLKIEDGLQPISRIIDEVQLKTLLRSKKRDIEIILNDYPEYFYKKFQSYVM